ncbi:Carbon catabolite repressor protein 4-like protein [Thalictrum thalictroides]|uniref:Carbon catabolite repressor protein 4-like protein n=1 Tax=Thalictrum thalictroides TaxID=46969 RepID=A0A7J6WH25_THATH|nr:Carbon catabolite repressor protein 4-like protein [Thalictrum thalictroides]
MAIVLSRGGLIGLKVGVGVGTLTTRFSCKMRKMMSVNMPCLPKFKSVVKDAKPTTSIVDDGFKFRVVSYNILAQVFVKSSFFPHSPSPCLRWKDRSQAILMVLKSLDSDFLCVQELDKYDDFYKEKLEMNGYSSIYIQRSGKKRDGCGIFYKHNSAELLLEEKIEYNDLVPSVQDENFPSVSQCGDAEVTEKAASVLVEGAPPAKDHGDRGDPNDPCVRLKRDCVAIMGSFKLKDPSDHHVIVANTHLYWDPHLADVKLAQAKYLQLRLSKFKSIISKKFGCNPSVIVCGDFNSTPGDKVYQCLVSGDSLTMPLLDGSEDLPIPLSSVYAFTGGEPTFTNCTPGFTNTIDYIFFSPSGYLKPVAVLELPGPESSDVVGGLPNFLHPSDHLPIAADFEIIQT